MRLLPQVPGAIRDGRSPNATTAKELWAYFQEVSGLGHFRPPLAQQMRTFVVSGSGIQGFFEPTVGANGGEAAN